MLTQRCAVCFYAERNAIFMRSQSTTASIEILTILNKHMNGVTSIASTVSLDIWTRTLIVQQDQKRTLLMLSHSSSASHVNGSITHWLTTHLYCATLHITCKDAEIIKELGNVRRA